MRTPSLSPWKIHDHMIAIATVEQIYGIKNNTCIAFAPLVFFSSSSATTSATASVTNCALASQSVMPHAFQKDLSVNTVPKLRKLFQRMVSSILSSISVNMEMNDNTTGIPLKMKNATIGISAIPKHSQ